MHHFVVPDMYSLPSGGNRYNACLTEALSQIGADVSAVEWETFVEQGKAGIFWIDTLYMERWATNPSPKPGQIVGLLVHHLESLYPPQGVDSDAYFLKYEQVILQQFDAFLVTSRFTRDYLRERGFNEKPIIVVPPALHQIPDIRISAESHLRALMVANLIERKGILELLRALAKRVGEVGEWSLTVIGSEELEPEYAAACRQFVLGSPGLVKSVQFTGPLDHESVMEHFQSSNLFVSAAKMETYGMALQEAVAVGLPILALAGGHVQAHVKGGGNGYLFGNVEEMADRFVQLSHEEELRRKLVEGAAASKPDPGYDWLAAARLYLDLVQT